MATGREPADRAVAASRQLPKTVARWRVMILPILLILVALAVDGA